MAIKSKNSEHVALENLILELGAHGVDRARIAFVLGSGLGAFAERVQNPKVISYEEIKYMPKSNVPGHAGELVLGEIEGVPVVLQKGRVHLYEGHHVSGVTRCVRAFAALGIKNLVLTNAAGGIEADWEVPTLMRITDHINQQGLGALEHGSNSTGTVYDKELGEALDRAAQTSGVELNHGVYMAIPGPSYETPAEIRLMRMAGASAVGMSTVQEATAARAAGMRVAAISTITNPAAGISKTALNHEEVVQAGQQVADRFCRFLAAFVPLAP
ncbi:MAG: purine-nucleoside phosphorylase [Candidatus Paceibacteria bacterium]|jgi:purine-nucleoside phosphorylase